MEEDQHGIPLVVIVGPTAVGKTEVAIRVALRVGGEVVSADSAQVYRGMDVGTAKPTLEERRGVPHHLIDVVNPDYVFNVAEFQRLADEAIRQIHARGNLPMLVGGTGLYVKAVVDRYWFEPMPADQQLRHTLRQLARRRGAAWLHQQLAEIDPPAAARIHPNDLRRVVRALEVYHRTGHPPSYWHRQRRPGPGYDVLMVGLNRPREELYARINHRVDRMMERGFLDEVRRLLDAGYDPRCYALQSLGYREMIAHLRGEIPLEEAVRLFKRNVRRLAKRQLTWFRRDRRIRWIQMGHHMGVEGVVEEIVKMMAGKWPERVEYRPCSQAD